MKIKTENGEVNVASQGQSTLNEDMPEVNKVYWYFKEKIFG